MDYLRVFNLAGEPGRVPNTVGGSSESASSQPGTTMSPSSVHPDFTTSLSEYIEASTQKYEACIGSLDNQGSITTPVTRVRFHYLRVDGNGQPKFKELAQVLADHLVQYSFSARRRGNPRTLDEHARLVREAKKLFRKMDLSGEAGEILLYFLLEAVIRAPQLVAKMELKQNPALEGHGSDGIHFRWCDADEMLELYFGEAKLEKTPAAAIGSLFRSLKSFHHKGLLDHEIGLVTSHFKHANAPMRQHVLDLIDRHSPAHNCRIHHACLVGYDWDQYDTLASGSIARMEAEFRSRYELDRERLIKLLQRRFGAFPLPFLRFELFLLPFRTVQEFRNAFNDEL